eukprot:tig00021099_g18217.t1
MDVESERPADYVPEIARAVADHMDDFNKVLNSFRCVVPDGLMVFIHEAFLTKPTAKPDRGSDVLPQGKKVFDADARPTYPDGHPTLAWKFGPNNAVVPDHEGRAAICGRILLAMLQGFQYPRIPLLAQRVDNCAPLNAAMPQNVAEVFRALLRTMTRDECADSDARALADGIRAYLTNMPHGLGYQRLELGSPPMAGAEDAWPAGDDLGAGGKSGIQRHLEAARAAEELENCPGNFPLGLIFTDEAIPLRPQFETMLRSLYADLNVAIRLARPIDWETDDPVLPDWDVEALRPALMWTRSGPRDVAGVRFQPPSTIVGGLADDPAEAAPSATRATRTTAVDPNDPFGLDAFLARQQGYDPKTMRVTVSDGKVKVERIAESAPPDQAPPAETLPDLDAAAQLEPPGRGKLEPQGRHGQSRVAGPPDP